MCWHVSAPEKVPTPGNVPTRQGADTCRHPSFLSYGLFHLQTGMCWQVSAPEKVPTPGKVPTRADTSRCRHVPTSLILIIWNFFLQTGMCWHVSAPEKVPTPGKVPTRLGADIHHINHMDFFICKLGCAGMCQHLQKCRHLVMCRNVPTRLGADIPDTNHMEFLFANWDVLACVSTWKTADTWEGAGKCRHV